MCRKGATRHGGWPLCELACIGLRKPLGGLLGNIPILLGAHNGPFFI